MTRSKDPYAEEKRLAQLAEDHRVPYEQVAAIEAVAERMKLAALHAISPRDSPNGLPRAMQAFDDLLAILTNQPEHESPRDIHLADLHGVPTRAVNYYEGRHQVTTVGELLDLGPVPEERGQFFGWHLVQQSLLAVCKHLSDRIDGAHNAHQSDPEH